MSATVTMKDASGANKAAIEAAAAEGIKAAINAFFPNDIVNEVSVVATDISPAPSPAKPSVDGAHAMGLSATALMTILVLTCRQ